MNYFRNIFETEVKDVQMNHTQAMPGREDTPDEAAYLYWVSGTQGMDVQNKSVGPAIALKVNAGDKVNLETWARYEHKEDYTEDVSLMMFSQLLGTSFAYIQGFDAMPISHATETFKGALPALLGAGVDASQPRAFLNYIVFNTKMEYVTSDRVQVSEAAGFEPDERAVKDMHERLAMNVSITEPGYIYAWVSNGSENTKVWFDDFSVAHTSNFVTQATDYGTWGDVLREQKTDESEYRYSYQGQYAEKDEETGWNHFELREYDPVIGRWTATDPAGQYWSPYIGMGNNPVNGVDPDGGVWVPDKNGNLVAEAGDNVATLATFLGISEEEAGSTYYNLQNWDTGGEALENVEGHTLRLDNVFTRSIEAVSDPMNKYSNNYNCWGATVNGIFGNELGKNSGIDTGEEFDRILQKKFTPASSDQATFGKTAIRFASDNTTSQKPNAVGATTHGAVFYGKSKDGTIYVYTKNGWYKDPVVVPLNELIRTKPNYGVPTGIGKNSGYYNLKQ